jgi:hypothetical protein
MVGSLSLESKPKGVESALFLREDLARLHPLGLDRPTLALQRLFGDVMCPLDLHHLLEEGGAIGLHGSLQASHKISLRGKRRVKLTDALVGISEGSRRSAKLLL